MDNRQIALVYAAGRTALGLGVTLAPGPAVRGMAGKGIAVSPGVAMIGRLFGARDAIIGAGGLAALAQPSGPDSDRALRPWLIAATAADAADGLATLLAYRHLPRPTRTLIALFALGGVATGAHLVYHLGR